jgi:hypothetical protein
MVGVRHLPVYVDGASAKSTGIGVDGGVTRRQSHFEQTPKTRTDVTTRRGFLDPNRCRSKFADGLFQTGDDIRRALFLCIRQPRPAVPDGPV